MADNLNLRGPADRSRININERWEVEYWIKRFGVSEAKLCEAVSRVGVMADAVRKHLGK